MVIFDAREFGNSYYQLGFGRNDSHMSDSKKINKIRLEGAGVTGKRPLVQIPFESLLLDDANPRLLSWFGNRLEGVKPSQFELLKVMYQRYDARSIAISMASNGYFDEEPLVVVPKDEAFARELNSKLKGKPEAIDAIAEYQKKGGLFVTVEGNRRLSALKLLLDEDARSRVKIKSSFPSVIDPRIIGDLSVLPCVVYPNRVEVVPYLGVKHIRGPLRWEAFSQAAYAAKIIDDSIAQDEDPDKALEQLERQTGNTGSRLKRLYIAYKIFKQLEQDIEIDHDAVIERFSFVASIYSQIPLRQFIGLKAPSATFLKERLISDDYLENAQLLFDWVFGNKENKKAPVIVESRDLTSRLPMVVQSSQAVAYLKEYNDLGGAYDRTDGELEFLIKKLQRSVSAVQQVIQVAYKFQAEERLVAKSEELEAAIEALRRQLRS